MQERDLEVNKVQEENEKLISPYAKAYAAKKSKKEWLQLENIYKLIAQYFLATDLDAIKLIYKYFQLNWNRLSFDPGFPVKLNDNEDQAPLFYLIYKRNPSLFPYILEHYRKLIEEVQLSTNTFKSEVVLFEDCIYWAFKSNDIGAALFFSSGYQAKNFHAYTPKELLEALSGKEDLIIKLLLSNFFDLEKVDFEYFKDEIPSPLFAIFLAIRSSFEKYQPEKLVAILKYSLEHQNIVLKCFYALLRDKLSKDDAKVDFQIIRRFLVCFKTTYGMENEVLIKILIYLNSLNCEQMTNKTLFKDKEPKDLYFQRYFKECVDQNILENNSKLEEEAKTHKPDSVSTMSVPSDLSEAEIDIATLKNHSDLLLALVELEATMHTMQNTREVASNIFSTMNFDDLRQISGLGDFLEKMKAEVFDSPFFPEICFLLGKFYEQQSLLQDKEAKDYESLSLENFLVAMEEGHDESFRLIIKLAHEELDQRKFGDVIKGLLSFSEKAIARIFPDLEVYDRILSLMDSVEKRKTLSLFLGKVCVVMKKFASAEQYFYFAASKGCESSLGYLNDPSLKFNKSSGAKAHIEASPDGFLEKISAYVHPDKNYMPKEKYLENLKMVGSVIKDLYQEKDLIQQDLPFTKQLRRIYRKLIQFSPLNGDSPPTPEDLQDLQNELVLIWQRKEKEKVSIDLNEILELKAFPKAILPMAKFYIKQADFKIQLKGLRVACHFISSEDAEIQKLVEDIYASVHPSVKEQFCGEEIILPEVMKLLLQNYHPEFDYQYQWAIDNKKRHKDFSNTIDVVKSRLQISDDLARDILINAYAYWDKYHNNIAMRSEEAGSSAAIIIWEILSRISKLAESKVGDIHITVLACQNPNTFEGINMYFPDINKVMESMLKYFDANRKILSKDKILEEIIQIAKRALEKSFDMFMSSAEVKDFYKSIASISKPGSCELPNLLLKHDMSSSVKGYANIS